MAGGGGSWVTNYFSKLVMYHQKDYDNSLNLRNMSTSYLNSTTCIILAPDKYISKLVWNYYNSVLYNIGRVVLHTLKSYFQCSQVQT